MGDAEMETLIPADSLSFSSSSSKEHSTSSVEPNKKRKLQCGFAILDMPSPKQRHRFGANICEQTFIRETQIDFEQPEEKSENDSNSYTRTCDISMASGVKVADENSFTLTLYQEQPSVSLNNYNDEVNITSLYSLESRDAKEVSHGNTSDLEDTLQFDPGHKVEEDNYSCFGRDYAILECESEGDAETESMVVYFNDVAPQSFFRSSGCWNLGQDAPLGKKKPTIDEEFEQHFSSLML